MGDIQTSRRQRTVLADGADLGGGPASLLALASLSRVLFIVPKPRPRIKLVRSSFSVAMFTDQQLNSLVP
jgi:hypothetical protein